ncbi:hypothetical protein A2316_03430 [Candidatus Falkowbacteria bacterium RIFOXYB2_FULL_38_15]|uniref:Uncharacterized protein n=1 Tax=Candidatus Falkowbacteria bacterium RIFOXYA2_FULL_38_12 TaxID=1797993 RepID=A0A1F5S3C2_9BACT|nr:MAG: hypothetical protein A2257_01795 [Candidatus Falkowbacteria bacterium RIFOXYA2_FULL_38_12]OGF32971.1 MAG: hypothetical protein A2316_03430 [Candidatus Falkowbacteria bacterium RIFOXYB2_FULL_38_15]OGF42631.1 MAG: hypothetical protein A2555_02510 [Candidatus Falkowbacteria bacterium RIFOXYD2_FULL_39_16]
MFALTFSRGGGNLKVSKGNSAGFFLVSTDGFRGEEEKLNRHTSLASEKRQEDKRMSSGRDQYGVFFDNLFNFGRRELLYYTSFYAFCSRRLVIPDSWGVTNILFQELVKEPQFRRLMQEGIVVFALRDSFHNFSDLMRVEENKGPERWLHGSNFDYQAAGIFDETIRLHVIPYSISQMGASYRAISDSIFENPEAMARVRFSEQGADIIQREYVAGKAAGTCYQNTFLYGVAMSLVQAGLTQDADLLMGETRGVGRSFYRVNGARVIGAGMALPRGVRDGEILQVALYDGMSSRHGFFGPQLGVEEAMFEAAIENPELNALLGALPDLPADAIIAARSSENFDSFLKAQDDFYGDPNKDTWASVIATFEAYGATAAENIKKLLLQSRIIPPTPQEGQIKLLGGGESDRSISIEPPTLKDVFQLVGIQATSEFVVLGKVQELPQIITP